MGSASSIKFGQLKRVIDTNLSGEKPQQPNNPGVSSPDCNPELSDPEDYPHASSAEAYLLDMISKPEQYESKQEEELQCLLEHTASFRLT
mmetsp:Transcript_25121/g.54245  ORF Transcript_25121/g.54245 Transcript_25121/m.54245 type:complete len:90 (-) Transcript_25121:572-841(-)